MAKQVGPLFITGTIDGIIFYKLGEQYYMRSKGSYKSGKKMRKDPRLKRTMQNADRFGGASQLVQYIYYRHLPREVRRHGLFGELTGMVNRWLYQGKSTEETEALLIAYCQSLQPKSKVPEATTPATSNTSTATPVAIKQQQLKNRKPKATKFKKARYLSQWKVKHNGRLHIPKSTNQLPCAIPITCHDEMVMNQLKE